MESSSRRGHYGQTSATISCLAPLHTLRVRQAFQGKTPPPNTRITWRWVGVRWGGVLHDVYIILVFIHELDRRNVPGKQTVWLASIHSPSLSLCGLPKWFHRIHDLGETGNNVGQYGKNENNHSGANVVGLYCRLCKHILSTLLVLFIDSQCCRKADGWTAGGHSATLVAACCSSSGFCLWGLTLSCFCV